MAGAPDLNRSAKEKMRFPRRKRLIIGAVLALIVLLALKVRLGLELFRKTDVGVVGGGVYVVMNQEKNTILLPGNITWEGLQRGEPETVMIEEGVIRPWAWTKAFSPNVYIVRFSSECVSVYDLRRFSGGYYQH